MAKTYKYCDSGTQTVSIDMSYSDYAGNPIYYSDTFYDWAFWGGYLTFTLANALPTALNVNFTYVQKTYNNGTLLTNVVVYGQATIPAGQSSYVHEVDPRTDRCYKGTSNCYVVTQESYTLIDQTVIPDCGDPQPSCFLGISATTITNATTRGGNDGEIAIAISGATGSSSNVSYSLNGIVYNASGSTTGYTFTGLTAGVYNIYITQGDCFYIQNNNVVVDGEFRTGDFYVKQPTGLTAVENPIIINVQTAINNASAVQDIVTFTFGQDLSDGDYIKFNLTSPFVYNQSFYSKNFPSKTNYFLSSQLTDANGTPAGTNSHEEIAVSFADALSNDALIPKIYYVNVDTNVVKLTAKETGTKFNLTVSNIVISTTGITFTEVQAGTDYCDGQISDNYSISCEVLVNTDMTNQYPELGDLSDYNKIAELTLPFNPVNNNHNFDISPILKSIVNTPKPDITLTGSTLLIDIMQPYYTKLNELYPLIANTNTVKKRYKTSTDIQWVINSSLDRFSQNNMDDYLGQSLTNITPNFTLSQTSGSTTIENYLISTGDTGTTNIMFSVWNSTNTSIIYNWQTGTTFSVSGGSYYMRISGQTDGYVHSYSKSFYNTQYGQGYDTTIQKLRVDGVKFLTNSPNPKQIQRNSNEFLYFILPKNYGTDLKVKGDLYFYDGTSSTGQTFFIISTGGTNAGGCMVMNISYDKLGLINYEVSGTTNRKIKRVEIAVYQNDGINGDMQYTEEKIYRFEIDEQPRKFGILFQNALGMYDAFDFVGIVEETISREVGLFTIPLDFNTDGSLSQGFKNQATYDTKITKKVIVNTGWIDENHFDWLMELLKSNNIYSTSITNQNYLNLIEFSYKKSSLEDLFDAEFTFEWTIWENNVSL